MKKYTRVYADINLDNIEYNVRALMALTKPGTKAMAVVKADAYGHGDVAVAKAVNDIELSGDPQTPTNLLPAS